MSIECLTYLFQLYLTLHAASTRPIKISTYKKRCTPHYVKPVWTPQCDDCGPRLVKLLAAAGTRLVSLSVLNGSLSKYTMLTIHSLVRGENWRAMVASGHRM